MTSNQIAYAANVETNRHNVKQEELYENELNIKQQQADTDREYKQTMADITRRYNDTYLELQQAQGDRKLDLQQQLNMIEQEKMRTDRYYKTEMAILESSRVDIAASQQKAQEEYWNRLVSLGYDENDIKRMQTMLEDKRIEYQKTQWMEQNELQRESISNQMRALNQQYTVNWLKTDNDLKSLDLKQQELSIEKQRLELENEKLDFQKKATAIQAAQHSVDRIWNPIKFFKSLGGNK